MSHTDTSHPIVDGPEIVSEELVDGPEDGIGLCLSGGGYRAMLFHVGTILRLNEFALLQKLSRVSSVSGGSITAGVLGLNWNRLDFSDDGRAGNLSELLVQPIMRMASKTIDRGSILTGVLLPGSVSDRIVGHYQDILFGDATLQNLPSDIQGPRFVINATSVQSGALVRMSRPYLADYRVGMIRKPTILLAEAVAASSAFPPFLSPAEIDVDPSDFTLDNSCDLQHEPYTDTLVLSDGGVYDNFGLETVWKRYKTLLVSDGGGKISPEPEPAGNWAQHSKRILDIIDNQVRSLRKRQLIGSFKVGDRDGAYWGIRTNIAHYQLEDAMAAPHKDTLRLADTPTRLKRLPNLRQQQLINWGYAVCDAAMRKHADIDITNSSPSATFPFKSAGIA
ncbi:patatin-like phospholipase family protein [uncultured Gimesia sp.]|uniref:patatin-like phospholipase family protein n=1 Tax=uncultured Gimesia sp. TaxID=1678688 RepID=UPI0030DDB01D|tara:strand:- start:37424 stop:38602 length:1179 start_codon:yes stop_codon:yes gene_type:complete